MGLSCGARVLKFCLFVFNLLFLFCGIACLCVGCWLMMDRYAVESLASAALKAPGIKDDALMDLATKPTAARQIGYALLAVGLIVLVVAFMGCCGAAKEWRPLLCCYATLLMAILAFEISAAIYAAMHSNSFQQDFRQLLKASLKMYNGTDAPAQPGDDNGTLVKAAWDKFMIEKRCCGIDSRRGDFAESGWFALSGREHEFPPACCPPRRDSSLMPHCPTISRYGEGCYKVFLESVRVVFHRFKVIMWTAGIISLIQIFGIIVAFCLCNAISVEEYY